MGIPLSGDNKIKFHRFGERLGLPGQLLEELSDKMIVVRYTEGSTIVSNSAPANFLFYLARGLVKVYCPAISGNRVLVRLAGPGDILGDTDLLNGHGARRHVYAIQAVNTCEVALLARDHVSSVLHSLEKGELIRLLEDLNTRWSEAISWHVRLFGLDLRERLQMVLADLSRRFGIKDKRGILIAPELSQLDLAEMIGSSRPMISRLVRAMTDARDLVRSGKQYIVSSGAAWLTRWSEPPAPEPPPSYRLRFESKGPIIYRQAS